MSLCMGRKGGGTLMVDLAYEPPSPGFVCLATPPSGQRLLVYKGGPGGVGVTTINQTIHSLLLVHSPNHHDDHHLPRSFYLYLPSVSPPVMGSTPTNKPLRLRGGAGGFGRFMSGLTCTNSSSIEDSPPRRPSAASTSSASSQSFPRTQTQSSGHSGPVRQPAFHSAAMAPLQQGQSPATGNQGPMGSHFQQFGNYPQGQPVRAGFAPMNGGPPPRQRRPSAPIYPQSVHSAPVAAQTATGGARTGPPPANPKKKDDEDAELAERMMDW
ncbi:hypothetical protein DB88DRAFT_471601 [Papiliotrema laurentii]|uniref:Uncharacterized protein n=1 Tax=Papiliotrema laurentii TaxID=5418 RepID=A0AAD9FSP6_PAPLA|nr:hypothetical protein DB88DRAFT_471601 [Papiliotrema laurentii]